MNHVFNQSQTIYVFLLMPQANEFFQHEPFDLYISNGFVLLNTCSIKLQTIGGLILISVPRKKIVAHRITRID